MTMPGVMTSTRRCFFGSSGNRFCVSLTSVGARAVTAASYGLVFLGAEDRRDGGLRLR